MRVRFPYISGADSPQRESRPADTDRVKCRKTVTRLWRETPARHSRKLQFIENAGLLTRRPAGIKSAFIDGERSSERKPRGAGSWRKLVNGANAGCGCHGAAPHIRRPRGTGRHDVAIQAIGSFNTTTTENGLEDSATNRSGVLTSVPFALAVRSLSLKNVR
jgi:hypothetical protein